MDGTETLDEPVDDVTRLPVWLKAESSTGLWTTLVLYAVDADYP